MNRYLVHAPGLYALPGNVCVAPYDGVPIPCDRKSLFYGALGAVDDEGERRSSLRHLLRNAVGEDEVGQPEWRAHEPVHPGRLVVGAATHQDRTRRPDRLLHEPGIGSVPASGRRKKSVVEPRILA